MENKLLNIIKLVSLSTVIVSGGFASRFGQARRALTQSKPLNFAVALAGSAYGCHSLDILAQREDSKKNKAARIVLRSTAIMARAALSNHFAISHTMQGLLGTQMLDAGYAHFQRPEILRKMLKSLTPEGHNEQNLMLYPMHAKVMGLNNACGGSLIFMMKYNLALSAKILGLCVFTNTVVLRNALLLQLSDGKQHLFEPLNRKRTLLVRRYRPSPA